MRKQKYFKDVQIGYTFYYKGIKYVRTPENRGNAFDEEYKSHRFEDDTIVEIPTEEERVQEILDILSQIKILSSKL